MFTKKFTKVFVLAAICLMGTVVSVLAAWGYGGPEAPYQGSYTYWHNSGGTGAGSLTSYAYNMKWTQSAINDMKGDGNNEWLDQTSDCTVNSPGNDRLHATSSTTNVPNNGYSIYNDTQPSEYCGGSSSSVKEEIELKINPYSLNTTTTYWQSVIWDCAYGGASGEINVSFEPASWAHEWLDKVNYWCYGGLLATTNDSNPVPLREGQPSENEPQLIREVDNGSFSYQVFRTSHGQVRIYSDVNFLDEQTLKTYRTQNDLELNSLLSLEADENEILAAITFTSPLSIEEAQSLAEQAQIEVISYGIFGYVEKDVVSTYVFPTSHMIEGFSQDEGLVENVGTITYEGIMTITGLIDTTGLQTVSQHSNVGLLDLTANRIKLELNDLQEEIILEQIAIPNPAWHVFTGELDLTK